MAKYTEVLERIASALEGIEMTLSQLVDEGDDLDEGDDVGEVNYDLEVTARVVVP